MSILIKKLHIMYGYVHLKHPITHPCLIFFSKDNLFHYHWVPKKSHVELFQLEEVAIDIGYCWMVQVRSALSSAMTQQLIKKHCFKFSIFQDYYQINQFMIHVNIIHYLHRLWFMLSLFNCSLLKFKTTNNPNPSYITILPIIEIKILQ